MKIRKREQIRKPEPQIPRVLIYHTTPKDADNRLDEILHAMARNTVQERCTSIDTLQKQLRRPTRKEVILILAPVNGKELATLLSIRHLMMDRRIILILPDTKEKTISDGHVLRPRFLSYADGDYSDVAAVMEKMLSAPDAASHRYA